LRVIDNGFTSPSNINYLTSLGHSIFLTDMVLEAWAGGWQKGVDEDGKPVWDVDGFLKQSLSFESRTFDVVLMWTALDYLPEALVAPVVSHLSDAMNPGGQVLAFFHTRTQGEETTRLRYHLTPGDSVDMQMTQQFPIQRAFTNRSIEKLFAGWSGHRQFLAKDSVSEVIMTRRTKPRNVGREQGLRKSAPAAKKHASACDAAFATAAIEARLSVMPGISGEHMTPARKPTCRKAATALMRRSGRGARGSSTRASLVFIVVTVI
jgi:hypothetical protein